MFIFKVSSDVEIEHFFSNSQIDKTMMNIQMYLTQSLPKINIKKILLDEGFQSGEQSSSDESDIVMKKKTKRTKKKTLLEHKPTELPVCESDSASITTLQQLLYETNLKVSRKDEQILQMTTNYLKDIQHLKQMFLRQIENPETEFIEANYFDIKQSLDPELQNYFQDKFNAITKSCQQTIQKYKIELVALNTECDSYKKTISVLLQNNSLQSIIKMLFLIEKDPYKIWKQIQDQVGNKVLFQVFDNQVGGYGINYREIDELIAKNSAGGRMFQRQKLLYEDQLKILIDENIAIINNLKQEITQLNQIINDLQQENEENLNKQQSQFNQILEEKLKEQYQIYFKEFQEQLQNQQQELSNPQLIKKLTTQCALARWINFARFYELQSQYMDEENAYDLKQRINHYLKSINDQFTIRDYEKLSENYQKAQYQIIQHEQEQFVLEQKIKQLQLEVQKYKNNYQMSQQTVQTQKLELQNYETTFKLISKPFCFILQKLGYPSKINLISLLKSGINLEFLQNEDQESKQTLLTYFQLSLSSQMISQQLEKRDKETITDFFDIRFTISQELNEEPQNLIEVAPIKFQITEQNFSPKDMQNSFFNGNVNTNNNNNNNNNNNTNNTNNNDTKTQKITRTSNPTNQSPKSNKVFNYNQINTPKVSQKRDKREESVQSRREKKSQKLLLETTSSGFQRQVEKVRRREHQMIEEIFYEDKAVQVDCFNTTQRNRFGNAVSFVEPQMNQQDVLVIMRDEDSRASSVIKKRSTSQNQKQQQTGFLQQINPPQNLTLYQASKVKGTTTRTLYSEQVQQTQQGFGYLPSSPFQFYQELFKEKQKLQLKNYTIVKEHGVRKKKLDSSIEGKHLQIPSYLK